MHFFTTSTLFVFTLLISNVAAHGLFTEIQGANGKNGVGLAITDPTGKKNRLFNQAPRFLKGTNTLCGAQKLDGKKETDINFNQAFAASLKAGLPTAAADGTIKTTLFQVNADGAGPYSCEVSPDGTGKNFQKIEVTKQVPGTKGKSTAKNQAFPFTMKLPTNVKCSGQGGACLVRCKSALSQPFGGCFLIGQGSGSQANKAPKALAVAKREPESTNEPIARDVLETEEQTEEVKRFASRFYAVGSMDPEDLVEA